MKSGRQKIRTGDERTGRRVGGRREEVDGGEAEVMLISGLEHLLQPSETTTPAGRTAAGDGADKAGPRSAPPPPATKTRPVCVDGAGSTLIKGGAPGPPGDEGGIPEPPDPAAAT